MTDRPLRYLGVALDLARSHSLQQSMNLGINRWERFTSQTRLRARPLVVEISPTKRCNISCVFCIKYRTKGPKDMTLERYNVIARMLFPTTLRVNFCTGGEPLINPLVSEFVTIADRYQVDSSLTTNGMLLTREVANHFVDTPHMVQVALSFDGATKETVESIRVGIDYDVVLENMQALLRQMRDKPGNTTQAVIRYSAMHRNLRELPEAVRMWGELGANQIIVRYLETTYGLDVHESLWFHKEETKEVFAEAQDMGRRYNIEVDLPEPIDGPLLERDCMMPFGFIFVDTDGTARFCYQAWEQPIGNILEVKDFDELWNNEEYRKIRATVNSDTPYFPYCKICFQRRGYGLETAHFHKTEESADLFTFEPDAEQHKRNAGIIYLTPHVTTTAPSNETGRPFVGQHESKRQSRSNAIGEWECEECGHITGGTFDVVPYTKCPECGADAKHLLFSAYMAEHQSTYRP